MGDAEHREKWLDAWWQGSGLVGLCPGCKRHVLFGYEIKRALADPSTHAEALLPENWQETAILAPNRKECADEPSESDAAMRLPDDWFNRAVLLDQDGNVISF